MFTQFSVALDDRVGHQTGGQRRGTTHFQRLFCTSSNLTLSLQGLICLNGDIIRKDTINQMPPGNAKSLMDSVFDLAQRINRFQLSDAEIGLFCAVVIITPGKCRNSWNQNDHAYVRAQTEYKMSGHRTFAT